MQQQLRAAAMPDMCQDHELPAVVCLQGVNHVKHMAAGALAACVSRTLVAPFERVKMECILRQRECAMQAREMSSQLAGCQMKQQRFGRLLRAISVLDVLPR